MTDNTREQTLLDQYWDADETNRRYIPAELDPSLRETIARLHAIDDAPDPDSEFVDQLWADLGGATGASVTSTSSREWSHDPDEESTVPSYGPAINEDKMHEKQQSIWRRRARQIGELVAGILVLAIVTGGLILAYQNMIGEGDSQQSPGVSALLSDYEDLLLFSGQHEDTHRILLASPDASSFEPLTDDEGNDAHPAWSPDGSQIAFLRSPKPEDVASLRMDPLPAPDLFLMNADGSDLQRLTDGSGDIRSFVWAPDGNEIAITVTHSDGANEIIILDLESGDATHLFDLSHGSIPTNIHQLTWSPDGSRFALFGSHGDERGQAYVVDRDGTDVTAVTSEEDVGFHGPAVWSTDGSQLAFSTGFGQPRSNVVVVNADGSNPRNLSNHDRTDTSPAWASDGEQIVFASQRSSAGDRGIYLTSVHNEHAEPLIETEGADSTPVWSPDGSQIAFVSQFTEGGFHSVQEWHVQVVDADGQNLQTVVEQDHHPGTPQWRPMQPTSADVDVAPTLTPDQAEAEQRDESSFDTDDHTVYFPRQSGEVDEYDDGAPAGTLAMDDQGCLRFGDRDGPLIIWPHSGFGVDVVDDEVALIDGESGDVIAFVGDEVSFHGSDPEVPLDAVPEHMLDGPIPEVCNDDAGFFVTGPGIRTP